MMLEQAPVYRVIRVSWLTLRKRAVVQKLMSLKILLQVCWTSSKLRCKFSRRISLHSGANLNSKIVPIAYPIFQIYLKLITPTIINYLAGSSILMLGWILAGLFFLTTIFAVIFAARTHLQKNRESWNILSERKNEESLDNTFEGDDTVDTQNLT